MALCHNAGYLYNGLFHFPVYFQQIGLISVAGGHHHLPEESLRSSSPSVVGNVDAGGVSVRDRHMWICGGSALAGCLHGQHHHGCTRMVDKFEVERVQRIVLRDDAEIMQCVQESVLPSLPTFTVAR